MLFPPRYNLLTFYFPNDTCLDQLCDEFLSSASLLLKDSKNSSIQRRTQKMGCSSAGEFMSSSKNGEKEWLAMDNPIYQNQRSQFLKTFSTTHMSENENSNAENWRYTREWR